MRRQQRKTVRTFLLSETEVVLKDNNTSVENEKTIKENCITLSTENEKAVMDDKIQATEIKKNMAAENEESLSLKRGQNAPIENEKNPSVSLQDCVEKSSASNISGESTLPSIAAASNIKDLSDRTLSWKQIVTGSVDSGSDLALHAALSSTSPKDTGESSVQADALKDSVNELNEVTQLGLTGEDNPHSVKDSDNLATVDAIEQISDTSMAVAMKPLSEEQETKQKSCSGSADENTDAGDRKGSPSNNRKEDNTAGINNDQNNHRIQKLQRAALTVLSAAAVKAKLLANQEEDLIRRSVSLVIEKQLRKLETKLSLFADIESVVMRMREQTERARQRLMHERAQIIALRLGLSAPARGNPPSLPTGKISAGYGNTVSNLASIASQKSPPMRRP